MLSLPLYNPAYIELHKDFERAIIARGIHKGKYSIYLSSLKEFLFFLETRKKNEISEVRTADVIAYYEYLRERPNQRREGGICDTHIRARMTGVKVFFSHLLKTGRLEKAPATLPSFTYVTPNGRNVLTTEEIGLLYQYSANHTERAILSLAYGCGLRRSEMEKLNIEDVLLHKGVLNVRAGKGNKSRSVPLSDRVIKHLKEYVVYERDKKIQAGTLPSAFLLNNWGGRMMGFTSYEIFKKLVLRTGDKEIIRKKVSLHNLRHSIATHLMDNGASMQFVGKLLGHSLLDTTHLYSKRRKQNKLLNMIK
jgi:integrase/recombinase XerD